MEKAGEETRCVNIMNNEYCEYKNGHSENNGYTWTRHTQNEGLVWVEDPGSDKGFPDWFPTDWWMATSRSEILYSVSLGRRLKSTKAD